jgi:hypothetical protein
VEGPSKAVSRMRAARDGGHRSIAEVSLPRYSYNTGRAGLVDLACYPARSWGVGFLPKIRYIIRNSEREVSVWGLGLGEEGGFNSKQSSQHRRV